MAIDSRIRLIMTTNVITVTPDTPVDEVARLIWKHKVGSVPVVENGRVIGMVTDYDLITRETEYDAPLFFSFLEAYFRIPGTGDPEQLRRILATTARELMTSPVVTVKQDDTVQNVATLMYEKRLNALPVVDDDGALVGIVSRADIVRLMVADEDLFERTEESDT
ncbi:MAG TPA: CBS domain-containing protein [Nitrolancea sp.]|nr:CBS domain-containing protein [Nitrolancea sp.]